MSSSLLLRGLSKSSIFLSSSSSSLSFSYSNFSSSFSSSSFLFDLSRDPLSGDDRTNKLAQLIPDWTENKDDKRTTLTRTFEFKNFVQAFEFMTKVGGKAEELDHHPEWFNVYNRVEVTLSTHTCGDLTDLDVALAKEMNLLYSAAKLSSTASTPETKKKQETKRVFALYYSYVPDIIEKRKPFREQHFQHIHKGKKDYGLLTGGVWLGEEEADKEKNSRREEIGAEILFQTNAKEKVVSFAEGDPYVQQGLVKEWSVREWDIRA